MIGGQVSMVTQCQADKTWSPLPVSCEGETLSCCLVDWSTSKVRSKNDESVAGLFHFSETSEVILLKVQVHRDPKEMYIH
jgi:hypothetical protein